MPGKGGSWHAFRKALATEGVVSSRFDTWHKGIHRLSAAHLDALVRVTGCPHAFWHGLRPRSSAPGLTPDELLVEWDAYLGISSKPSEPPAVRQRRADPLESSKRGQRRARLKSEEGLDAEAERIAVERRRVALERLAAEGDRIRKAREREDDARVGGSEFFVQI